MRRLLAPVPLAVLGVVVALVALLAYGLASNEPDAEVAGEPAPALELPRLSGGGVGSLEDYRGRVVVLNFWASWCEPCREESPLLQRWHERIERRGRHRARRRRLRRDRQRARLRRRVRPHLSNASRRRRLHARELRHPRLSRDLRHRPGGPD